MDPDVIVRDNRQKKVMAGGKIIATETNENYLFLTLDTGYEIAIKKDKLLSEMVLWRLKGEKL